MTLTRREIHFLIALAFLTPILAIIPQETVNEYEVFFLAFVGFPLGLYLVFDKERIPPPFSHFENGGGARRAEGDK